jgi:aquaporin Z
VARATGFCSGALVVASIILESPLSGASLNPARTLAAALLAQLRVALWIYFLAPPLGMLCAAQVYLWSRGADAVTCARLHRQNERRCIFRCGYRARARKSMQAHTPL